MSSDWFITGGQDNIGRAEEVAEKYQISYVANPKGIKKLISVYDSHIAIKTPEYHKEFYVDFLSYSLQNRLPSLREEAIVKACGVKNKGAIKILDLTAGWGSDAFMLASSGANVTLVERDPIVFLLLEDGIRRLLEVMPYGMQAINIDAMEYLDSYSLDFDVIYLDPIRKLQNSNAKNKKEMEMLRSIIQKDQHYENLLNKILTIPNKKVVLKLGKKEILESRLKPNFIIKGTNTKFLVFLTN